MCHESARYMSCAAVSQKGCGSCCHERDFAPSLALRALVVHLSAGRSQRPLGVMVEDSPLPALLFSGRRQELLLMGLGGKMIWTL